MPTEFDCVNLRAIECLTIDSKGNVFAGTGGMGVFKSVDNGSNWTFSSSGIDRADVVSTAIDPNGELFAATTNACLFRTSDDGQT